MSKINKQARELNKTIKANNPFIYNLLSEKGRAIFFPKEGILAQSAEAKGKRINATIGIAVEDDGTPMRLSSIAQNITIEAKDVFPYAPSYGKPELRKEWQKMIKEKNPCLKSEISLPVVTCGLTHALSVVGYLFINPGEKIIITDKFWENYKLVFENTHGGIISTFNTFKNKGLDIESFRKKIKNGDKKKIILLNFPNNPAGYTPTNEEVKEIIKIIEEAANVGKQILVILDDAYFGLVYEKGIYQESLFAPLASLHKNILAVKIDGASKEDYAWGLRIGFITLGAKGTSQTCWNALEVKMAGVIRGNISSASNLSQSLLLEAMKSHGYQEEKRKKYQLLKSRFNKVQEILKNKKYQAFFSPLPYNSGYFMCLELKKGLVSEKIRRALLDKYDTGVIARGNLLRIAYSSVAEKNLPTLFENIYQACQSLKRV